MSIEEVQKRYNEEYKQIGPAQKMTLEEYKTSGLGHGLQCVKCMMVVSQDATVYPGICLGCYHERLPNYTAVDSKQPTGDDSKTVL